MGKLCPSARGKHVFGYPVAFREQQLSGNIFLLPGNCVRRLVIQESENTLSHRADGGAGEPAGQIYGAHSAILIVFLVRVRRDGAGNVALKSASALEGPEITMKRRQPVTVVRNWAEGVVSTFCFLKMFFIQ